MLLILIALRALIVHLIWQRHPEWLIMAAYPGRPVAPNAKRAPDDNVVLYSLSHGKLTIALGNTEAQNEEDEAEDERNEANSANTSSRSAHVLTRILSKLIK